MLTLNIETRDLKAKLADIRETGKIPAVFYGKKEASTPIALSEVDFMKAWKQAGESSIIVLKGVGDEHEALIHDIDLDPVTGKVRHADFYVIEKGKKLKLHIPVEFDGVAPAVKELGGTLVKVLHEIEIEALPKDLPHSFVVDISSLVNFESQIKAGDIKLPAGVTLITNPDEVVILAAEAKEEVEEVSAPVDLSTIEVSEKRGKEVKEGEEEAPAESK
jgi:large subunit ribosomal protein L25